MPKTQVMLVGGFLGAGKTTLLARATEQLVRQGKRVGLITNDQVANLVDTAILKEVSDAVQEVAGGCFCRRFDELMAAMDQLVDTGVPEMLIGEPVGRDRSFGHRNSADERVLQGPLSSGPVLGACGRETGADVGTIAKIDAKRRAVPIPR